MILITGGAYQGKLDFARRAFGIADDDVTRCTEETVSLPDTKVICGLDKMIYGMTVRGEDAEKLIADSLDTLRGRIIIADDVSRGLVPTDKTERAFRETNGRCLNLIAAAADEVYTVFCGIGNRIK